jgi:hypothetical protein
VSGAERDPALFNLAIDSKLRDCDLVTVGDIALSGVVRDRAVTVQRKTGRPVQFEITEQTRDAVGAWITRRGLTETNYLFPSRLRAKPHMSTRQYGRIVDKIGCEHRARPEAVWNAFDETHESFADLQEGRQYPGRAAAPLGILSLRPKLIPPAPQKKSTTFKYWKVFSLAFLRIDSCTSVLPLGLYCKLVKNRLAVAATTLWIKTGRWQAYREVQSIHPVILLSSTPTHLRGARSLVDAGHIPISRQFAILPAAVQRAQVRLCVYWRQTWLAKTPFGWLASL